MGLGGLLLPVFGHEVRSTPARVGTDSAVVLGLTPSKPINVNLLSARDPDFPKADLRAATGDTYLAAGLVQDATTAWYLDDYPDNHTFSTGDETAGINLISNVDTRIVGTDLGPGAPGTNFLQVNYYTSDGSDIVPAGTLSPDGAIFDSWRFDVGTVESVTDKINWTPNPGFTVLASGFCLVDAGGTPACFDLIIDDSDANGVAGVGVVGLGGADIAGYGINEMIMYWEIQVAPSCGDGNVDAGEECDDGNTLSGDGCSATCQSEGTITGDLDGDGDVDLADFAILQSSFEGP